MPKISVITGSPVLRPDGKRIGLVEHVLFHPEKPRVIGFEVERPLLLNLFHLSSRFLPLASSTISDDGYEVHVDVKRLPSPGASSKETGIDWDKTVIWRDMPVTTEAGEDLGRVGDIVFGATSGKITKVTLTEGAATDAGVGKRVIPGEDVVGFDGEGIRVRERVAEKPTSGGAATAAGIGTAVAKEVLGRAAGNVARKGGELAGKAARRLKKSTQEWKELLGGE